MQVKLHSFTNLLVDVVSTMRRKSSARHLCFRSKINHSYSYFILLKTKTTSCDSDCHSASRAFAHTAGSTIWRDLPWDTKAPWLLQSPQTSLQVKDRPNSSQTLLPQLLAGYYSTTVVMDIQLEGCALLLGMKTIVAFISGWFKVLNEGSKITHALQ